MDGIERPVIEQTDNLYNRIYSSIAGAIPIGTACIGNLMISSSRFCFQSFDTFRY
jgi:hypothetical protein